MSAPQSLQQGEPQSLTEPATVFIVDDNQSTIDAVTVLCATVGLKCVGFTSAEAYLQARPVSRPGCLVLDVVLDGISGLDLQSELITSPTPIPIIMISAHADVSTAVRCMENGAITLLEKPCEDNALLDAIERAVRYDREQQRLRNRLEELESIEQILADRERAVLDRVIDGRLNKKIARDLNVSERTVENVRAKLMRKFQADNATELASKYTELHLLRDLAHRICPQRGPHYRSRLSSGQSDQYASQAGQQ